MIQATNIQFCHITIFNITLAFINFEAINEIHMCIHIAAQRRAELCDISVLAK